MLEPSGKHILPQTRPTGQLPTSPRRKFLPCCASLKSNGALDTAQRVMQMCGQIFMYAIATGRAERNPVPDLRGALKTPVIKHHAYLKAADLPEFLKKLEAYDGSFANQTGASLPAAYFRPHDRTARGRMDGNRLGQGRMANSCRTHEDEGTAYRAAVESGCRCVAGIEQAHRQSASMFSRTSTIPQLL